MTVKTACNISKFEGHIKMARGTYNCVYVQALSESEIISFKVIPKVVNGILLDGRYVN